MAQYRLPGVQQLTPPKPLMPVLIAIGLLAGIVGALYAWPYIAPPAAAVQPAAQATTTIAATPPALGNPPDLYDAQHHLDVGREHLLRSSEELVRAERDWAAVSARLNRNYLAEERRRADRGTAAAASAREALEHALDEFQIAREHLK